jgi:hypothetical protein
VTGVDGADDEGDDLLSQLQWQGKGGEWSGEKRGQQKTKKWRRPATIGEVVTFSQKTAEVMAEQ